MFEACSARPPVDLPFRASSLTRRNLSTAAGTNRCVAVWPRAAPAAIGPQWRADSARQDRAASAVAARVCVLHPVATTAPDPHSKTPLEAPLVDRGIRPV